MNILESKGGIWAGAAYNYIRSNDNLPMIGSRPDDEPSTAVVKLFNPNGAGTWWIAEHDPETGDCFGCAEIFERELGYFNIRELIEAFPSNRHRLPIERDIHFKPCPLSELTA